MAMKATTAKVFQCMECGRRMTVSAAQRSLSRGCAGCGGTDIDLSVPSVGNAGARRAAQRR